MSRAHGTFNQNVVLSLDDVGLLAELSVPAKATSVILCVSGSGSSRLCKTSRFLAQELNRFGHATLLFDIMTPGEESNEEVETRRWFGFQYEFLAHRIMEASKWLQMNDDTRKLPLGYFCAAGGVEGAFMAASHLQKRVRAIVSCNGWIDSDIPSIENVHAPTLLIAKESELEIVLQTRSISKKLECEHHVEIVKACHFQNGDENINAKVAELTQEWFSWHISRK